MDDGLSGLCRKCVCASRFLSIGIERGSGNSEKQTAKQCVSNDFT